MNPSDPHRKWKRLPVSRSYILAAAFTLCVTLFLESYIDFKIWKADKYDFPLVHKLMHPIGNYFVWAFLAGLIYNNLQRFNLKKIYSWKVVAGHLIVAIGIILLQILLSNLSYYLVIFFAQEYPFSNEVPRWPIATESLLVLKESFVKSFPGDFITRFIEYFLIVGVFLAIDYSQAFRKKSLEVVKMEKQLSDAQLHALKMQLEPHFLFNALNAVSSLMDTNVKEAQTALARLGFLLRTMLRSNGEHFRPLETELEYVKSYLEMEQLRFNDRLHIRYHIDPKTKNALVPVLILQPLVENAIKHGFSEHLDECTISVNSELLKDQLELSVTDNGRGAAHPEQIMQTPGVGLGNVMARLKEHYQDHYSIQLLSQSGEGFSVKLTIPYNPDQDFN